MFRDRLGDLRLGRARLVHPGLEALEARVLLSAPATFVSKSVANHAVFMDGTSFTQTFKIRNTGTTAWNGHYLVRMAASDALGGSANSVAVPTTAPGATATITLSLKAIKTIATADRRQGAAQLGGWQLRTGSTASSSVVNIDGLERAANKTVLWTAITIASNVYGPGIPRLDHVGFTSTINPYVGVNLGGQCTAFVWGRAKEMRGVNLPVSSQAGQSWINALTGSGKPYKLSAMPKANSIAVWSYVGGGGHVAYVESVSGAGKDLRININEANWSSFQSYASVNDPSGNEWGGGYDGSPKSFTQTGLEARSSTHTFLGYILLQ